MIFRFRAALFAAAAMLPIMPAMAEPAATVAAPQGRVATAVFGKRPFMQTPLLSPDGTKVAVKLSSNGEDYLAIIDLATPTAKPDLFIKAEEYREVGDRTVGTWRWVGNETVVVQLRSRENISGQRVDIGRLIGYNIKTKKITPLAWEDASGDASDILYIDHDKGHILLSRGAIHDGSTERAFNPEVVDVDVATGKFTIVMRANPQVQDWIADGHGVVRAGVANDRDTGKQRLMYRSDANGVMRTVSNEADPSFTGTQIVPQLFLDEPDMAVATSNRDGYRKVYKLDMRTMKLGDVLYESPGYDAAEGGLIRSFDRTRLLGVSTTDTRTHEIWFDPTYKEIQQVLDESFGKDNAQIVSRDRDDRKLIVFIGKTDQSGGYYLYDTQSGRFGLLGWVHPILKDMELNPTHTIRYPTSDGKTVEAVVTMPRHRMGAKNLPVVMITHGGPFGPRDSEEFGFFPWHQAMAELGYVVIQPNYRGSGGYGKDWVKAGRDNGFGLRMQDDLNEGIDYLAAQGVIDPKRACMMGWSYGGYASARAAQRDPARWRCTIAGAGVYDLSLMRRYDSEYLGEFGSNYLAKGAAELSTVSPALNANGKWAPIMIVHGVRDQRVPIEQARTLVARLKGAGKVQGTDFDYLEQPKNTHNLPYEDVHTQWLEAAERWLDKNNPAYVPTDPDKPVAVAVDIAATK